MTRWTLFHPWMVLFWLLLCWPATGRCETAAEIAAFFRPVEGVLIQVRGDEYLVNLDASKGVMVGDLLSIVTPGEPLTDPISGKVLGSLDTVHGVLKVTRVRSGYCEAEPLGKVGKAARGAVVRRFRNLSAGLFDPGRSGEALYARLVEALPALEWQGYHPGAVAGTTGDQHPYQLNFVLQDDRLAVYDSRGGELRVFSSAELPPGSAARVIAAAPVAEVRPPERMPEAEGAAGYAADFPGYRSQGNLSIRALAAALADSGGKLFLAASDGSRVHVYALPETQTPLASDQLPGLEKIHALAWWQPDSDGPLFLVVTASLTSQKAFGTGSETEFSSLVYRWSDGRLQRLARNLPYLLGSFDVDGDGTNETLLAQRFDLDMVFGPVRRLTFASDGQLVDENAGLDLPLHFPVIGSVMTDLTGDGRPDLAYIRKGILYVFSQGQPVYESAKQMGGSLAILTYASNPGQADPLLRTARFEVPPLSLDIDGDGQRELIVVSSDRSSFSAPGFGSDNNENWLTVVKYRGGRFVKGTLGDRLENSIQGLFADQDRILLLLTSGGSFSGHQQSSHLVGLPLKK